MLGEDLLDRPRHGRIRLRGRWVHFPLKPLDLVSNLPLSFTAGALSDSLKKFVSKPSGDALTFADVSNAGSARPSAAISTSPTPTKSGACRLRN
jgi:hypothetical protein